MTIQEQKAKLIDVFNAKCVQKMATYKRKVDGMNSTLIQQEYDLVVLGKKNKPKKKSYKASKEKESYNF